MSSPTPDALPVEVAELLSALLDGAVTDDERATAEAWLERSAEARAEYATLAQVKAALGGMGEVEPPFGFYDRMLRQGTPEPEVTSAVDRKAGRSKLPRRLAGAAVAAIGAAAALVVIGGTKQDDVLPPIEAVAAGDADDVRTFDGEQGPVNLLRQEAGGVQWDELPEGVRLDDGETEIWQDLTTDDGEERVIVFRGGVVVTVFASSVEDEDEAVDELIAEATEVIEDEPAGDGIVDRFQRGIEKLVDAVTPD
jgi:anti-sigma factor RsiW